MSVNSVMYYAEPKVERPAYYLCPPPPDAEERSPGRVGWPVEVADVRSTDDTLSLDEQGFEFVKQTSGVTNFYDPEEVRNLYYPEIDRLVREHTGAREVLVFDHNVRSAEKAERQEDGAQMPVKAAHNDYTEGSGPQRVHDLLPDRATSLLERRFAVINVWRPIVGPVLRSPLAVLDATSMQPEDFVATDLVYKDRVGEIYTIRYSPEHRWYFLSAMQTDDVLLLKCFDSDPAVTARFTAHSAFELDGATESTPHRESIEVRTLAFY